MVRLKLPHRILIFTVLAIAVFALFPLVPRPEMLRVAGTGRDILAGDFGGRLTIWREGIEVFYEHPILGVGSGAIYSKIPGILGAHNVFLSVLVQVGIIGLALYATILAISIHYAISQPKWDSIFWCTLLLIWAIGNISNSWVYREPTWLILGLVAASAGLYVRNKDKIPLQVSPNEPRESPDYSV